jgi:hypothetical protein
MEAAMLRDQPQSYTEYPSVVPSKEPSPPRAERPPGILPEPIAVEKHTGIPLTRPTGLTSGVADRTRPLSLRDMARRAGG